MQGFTNQNHSKSCVCGLVFFPFFKICPGRLAWPFGKLIKVEKPNPFSSRTAVLVGFDCPVHAFATCFRKKLGQKVHHFSKPTNQKATIFLAMHISIENISYIILHILCNVYIYIIYIYVLYISNYILTRSRETKEAPAP